MPFPETRTHRRVVGLTGLVVSALLLSTAGVTAQSPTPSEKPLPTQVPVPSLPVPVPAGTSLGDVTAGINERAAVPYTAATKLIEYCNVAAGINIQANFVDHNTFQDTISQRLTGTPEDILKWFAGERLKFFADQGLVAPIDDVWAEIGANYSDAMKEASKGSDGKYYFVPMLNYPWVVQYRKSLFAEKGYTIPKTIDEFKALGDQMKKDGLVPLAYGDKDGWPAMGTFDILNMRMNGYDFHIGLMSGKEKWTDPRVKAVFEAWAGLMPYFQEGATGRIWDDAAKAMLVDKTAGMYFLGTFAAQQANQADISDVGFFPFPLMGTQFDAENAIDAPIDGFMLSANPKNPEAAKAFLKCLATPEAQKTWVSIDNGNVAAVNNADTSGYNGIQKASVDIIASSGKIAQFMDRDTRADFAGKSGMQNFLQKFLADPTQDLDAFLSGIQQYYDSLDPLQ